MNVSCLVDTDIIIDYLRNIDYAPRLLRNWSLQGFVAISSLTHFEVLTGILPREELNTHEFLQSLTTIAADAVICQEAGHINLALRRRGQTIGVADLIIAATASAVDVPLITNNVKHFTIPGLTIIRGTTGTRFVRERRQRYATR